MENQNVKNEEFIEIEDISNEEFKKRFLEKYKQYKAGKLTEKDFDGYEVFMLSKMTKAELDILKNNYLKMLEDSQN